MSMRLEELVQLNKEYLEVMLIESDQLMSEIKLKQKKHEQLAKKISALETFLESLLEESKKDSSSKDTMSCNGNINKPNSFDYEQENKDEQSSFSINQDKSFQTSLNNNLMNLQETRTSSRQLVKKTME